MVEGTTLKRPNRLDILNRPKRINLYPDDDNELSPEALYLRDIRGYPVPKSEQVVCLFQGRENNIPLSEILRAPSFDRSFRAAYRYFRTPDEVMVAGNQRLVVEVASRYYERGIVTFLDFVSFGNIGLRRAIEKYNFRIGEFSTYAVYWIRQGISLGISSEAYLIYIPIEAQRTLSITEKTEQQLLEELGRSLTDLERRQAYKKVVPAKAVEIIIEARESGVLNNPASLNLPRYINDSGEDTEAGEKVESPKNVEEQTEAAFMEEVISDLIDKLPPRLRQVIRIRYGLYGEKGRTLEETGAYFGVAKERIRQLENEALGQLRNPYNLTRIEDFRQDATVYYPPADLRPEPRLIPSRAWVEFRKNGPVKVIQNSREKIAEPS